MNGAEAATVDAAFRNDLRLLRDRLISNLSVGVVSFPDFGEFEEDTVRREHRDDQSRNAVAEATKYFLLQFEACGD